MQEFGDIIIFALIAFVLCIKLFSILGQKRGKEDNNNQAQPQESTIEQDTTDLGEQQTNIVLDHVKPEEKVKIFDPTFNQSDFIKNATNAYQIIFDAFAKGNTEILSELVNIEVLRDLAYKISVREDNKQKKTINITKIGNVIIKEITMNDYTAEIKMIFPSEVISYTTEEKGKCIEGHKSKVNKRNDEWLFSRDIRSTDPTWKLVSVSPEIS